MITYDVASPVGIAAVIIPLLDSKHLAIEAHHQSLIQCCYKIPFVEDFPGEMGHQQVVDSCAKQSQIPWALTEKSAPRTCVPLKERATGCKASQTLPVCETYRDPYEPKKLSKATRVKTISKTV